MVKPVFLTPEQVAVVELCKTEALKFSERPGLHGSASAISAARSLINRAHAAGVPEVAYVGLQLAVSAADIDASLPGHLRQFQPLP